MCPTFFLLPLFSLCSVIYAPQVLYKGLIQMLAAQQSSTKAVEINATLRYFFFVLHAKNNNNNNANLPSAQLGCCID